MCEKDMGCIMYFENFNYLLATGSSLPLTLDDFIMDFINPILEFSVSTHAHL